VSTRFWPRSDPPRERHENGNAPRRRKTRCLRQEVRSLHARAARDRTTARFPVHCGPPGRILPHRRPRAARPAAVQPKQKQARNQAAGPGVPGPAKALRLPGNR